MTGKIPDKIYFKIGEVSKIVGVKPYVVRFWESEFKLRREKTRSSHRIYRRKDIETLLMIKDLLYNQKFTIEGARKKLKELQREAKVKQLSLSLEEASYRQLLKMVRGELAKIKEMLDNN